MLKSQEMRKLAPELDPLRIGTGWKPEDLEKVQVMIESTVGDSHPGSGHLGILVEEARKGVKDAGGFGARYACTDICDGESQGTDGINFSLASREMIANMIEIHANATPFDAGIYIASCDKGMPGNLMGMLRADIPGIVIPGGTMNAGPEMLTLEQLGKYSAQFERGEIDEERLNWAKRNACPSCGACSFIGTASTMQIMAEALGLALPGSALMPAMSADLKEYAYQAGQQAVRLATMEHMKPSELLTMDSFENAVLVHAAISGSTNCLLHIPAIAHEIGLEITGDTFDRLHRNMKYILDLRPAGKYPAECFYYAGGVPAIMEEIKESLHLDAMTVTGKTLGENLEELKNNGYYERCQKGLAAFNQRYGTQITRQDIIHPSSNPIGTDGSIAVLYGNLAPEGAVIKHTACPKEMFQAVLRARPFDSEEECLQAVLKHEVQPNDAVFIRYEGPKGSGMPEMFYTSEAISSDPELGKTIALITDGRFSGASTGPVIGHCSPEAASGGPIALVEEGDLIEIDVMQRKLNIIGIDGVKMDEEQIQEVLAKRKEAWKPRPLRYKRGVLRMFSEHAVSPMKGAYLDFDEEWEENIMNAVLEKLSQIGVVPVIALNDAKDALPLAKALCEGGIPCAEVTFRTSAAEETIRIMSQAYPDMIVGAGTVLTTEQVDRTIAAGGQFVVSPGFDPEIVDYCLEKGITVIPGLLTPSEVAQAVKRNLEVVKFFPAESFGGLKTIKAIAAPYNQMLFMPSGGVNLENMKAYLEYDRIACVGGSWMVKQDLIENGEFEKIKTISKEASDLVKAIRG